LRLNSSVVTVMAELEAKAKPAYAYFMLATHERNQAPADVMRVTVHFPVTGNFSRDFGPWIVAPDGTKSRKKLVCARRPLDDGDGAPKRARRRAIPAPRVQHWRVDKDRGCDSRPEIVDAFFVRCSCNLTGSLALVWMEKIAPQVSHEYPCCTWTWTVPRRRRR